MGECWRASVVASKDIIYLLTLAIVLLRIRYRHKDFWSDIFCKTKTPSKSLSAGFYSHDETWRVLKLDRELLRQELSAVQAR